MQKILRVMAVIVGLSIGSSAFAEEKKDMMSGTWHIQLKGLFGEHPKRGPKNLDIYPVFENGKMVNAVATARAFNTSVHFVQDSEVVIDPAAKTIKGKMKILMTPDLWVPKDGKTFEYDVILDGTLTPKEDGEISLGGKFEAKRLDGLPVIEGTEVFKGDFGGAVGVSQTGWENSVWQVGMSQQVPDPDYVDQDAVQVRVGIANGKVNWGTVGIMAQAKWPAHKEYPIDVSKFGPVGTDGIVEGNFEVTGRHLHPGGDPEKNYKVEVKIHRVQGLIGGHGSITPLGDGADSSWPRGMAGRGSGRKGGGEAEPFKYGVWRYTLDNREWWKPVEGFKEPAAGEHPRLLFRKEDVATLRERANTPQGKAILARLRQSLGNNGEAVPTVFNQTPPHNHNKSPKDQPEGSFTTWHAAGYGFLYQITGDKKYAELSKQCVEFMLEGKYDVDNRYSWIMPGTDIRCGSVLGAMAYSYDFCYDAWPEDFRKKIALELQNFDKLTASSRDGWEAKKAAGKDVPEKPSTTSIKKLSGRSGYPPGSNHYGSLIGGTCIAMLAIRNDPGVDNAFVDARIRDIESNMPRMMALGFGDGGYYAEGIPPSRLSSEGGFLELLYAMKIAGGRDYINVERPNSNMISLRWIYHIGGNGYASLPSRGVYGGDTLTQDGVRGSFAFGFGAIQEKYRPAFLWTYDTFVKHGEEGTYNSITYPITAVYAFLNWPKGSAANPEKVLPKVLVDTDHGYIVGRNQWKDENDIIVTHLVECGPKGYYSARDGNGSGRAGNLRAWGLGKRNVWSVGATGQPSHFRSGKDGSFILTAGSALAVDMSGKSGAELVVVTAGNKVKKSKKGKKKKGKEGTPAPTLSMDVDGESVAIQVFSISSGTAPEASIEGNKVVVGGQSFTFDGKNLSPSHFEEAK